jgi:hypothetical protein
MRNEREYGLGDSTPFVKGPPRVKGQAKELSCPACKCQTMYDIEVDVEHPLLRGGKGVGHYVGCPACPFASPMLMVAE